MQISANEYREIRRHRDKQKSRYEQEETSKDGATKSRVTSQILLNKWQRQKEKDYQRWLEDQEYQHQLEEERYERKQAEAHWNCPFFRYCWNEGLKLPTRNNCPEVVSNIGSLGNLKPTASLSMLKTCIIVITWIGASKIEVFMIGLENELLIKTGLIKKKKVMRKNMFGRKPEKKSATAKEQRTRKGSSTW